MTLVTVSINGTPVEDLGFFPTNLVDWLSLPVRTFQTADVMNVDGQVPLSYASRTGTRQLGLGLYAQSPSSLTDRRDKLNELWRAFNGLVEVCCVDDPNKVCYGLLTAGPVRAASAPASLLSGQPQAQADVTVVCHDPLWYARNPAIASVGAVNVPVPLPIGTSSARIRNMTVTLYGAVTPSPTVITLKNASGTELARWTLSQTLTASQYVQFVRSQRGFSVTMYSGGVATDWIQYLGASESFFDIDPQDLPTIETTRGTLAVSLLPAFLS
jgi:hypothetical protein